MVEFNTTPGPDSGADFEDWDRTSRVNAPEPLDIGELVAEGLERFSRKVRQVGSDIAGGAVEVAILMGECFSETGSEIVKSLGEKLAFALQGFGDKPGVEPSAVSRLIQFVPFVGSAKGYATAWRTYHEGKERNDGYLMEEGRIGCLVALAEAKIDICAFGIGRILHGRKAGAAIATGINMAMAGRLALHAALEKDVLRDGARKILNYEYGRIVADEILSVIKPAKGFSEQPEQEAVPA